MPAKLGITAQLTKTMVAVHNQFGWCLTAILFCLASNTQKKTFWQHYIQVT